MIDPARFSALFDAHAVALVLYAGQFLKDRAGAEDVVHDAFVSLMTQTIEPRDAKAWMYRAVRNASVSRTRSSWRRTRRERAVSSSRQEMFESRMENLIDARAAEVALGQLSTEQREVVVLKIWGEMGFAEISQLVGCSLSTAHERYQSALAAMKQRLEKSSCPNTNP